MVHWTQNSHRLGKRIDYRRWVVLEVAKQCGVDEDAAYYYTRLKGWETDSKSAAPRTFPSDTSPDQFISIVACTEWRNLSVEQAKEVARAAGITDDGESRKLKWKDPRPRRNKDGGSWMSNHRLSGGKHA